MSLALSSMQLKRLLVVLCLGAMAPALMLVMTPPSEGGPQFGKLEANFYAPSYEQGSINVSLFVTATETPGDDLGQQRDEFDVLYNSGVFKFFGHDDGGVCRMRSIDAAPFDKMVSCKESPGSSVKKDTFYFGVLDGAPLGAATMRAQANYGKIDASVQKPATTQIVTSRPTCSEADFNFRGFCVPNDLTFLISVVKRLQKASQLSPADQKQLVKDVYNYEFWRQLGEVAALKGGGKVVPFISQLVGTFLSNQGRAS